jgi:hypothetical protein
MKDRVIPCIIGGEVVPPLQLWVTWPISQGIEAETERIIDVVHNGHDILVFVTEPDDGATTLKVRFPLSALVDAVFDAEDDIRDVTADDARTMRWLRSQGTGALTHPIWEEGHKNRPV